MEELFKAYLTIKDYCFSHKCDINCSFYCLGGGCELCQNKKPRFWKDGSTLLKGATIQTLHQVKEGGDENV